MRHEEETDGMSSEEESESRNTCDMGQKSWDTIMNGDL